MSLAGLLAQLDSNQRTRGQQFERLCRWYLNNAPEYRGRFKRVSLWAEWPGAWAPDAGIDLVAEEHDGCLWAIQAKAYDPAYAIKKSDVDSFLSESSRPEFSYRLLIATTDRLGPTAKRTLDAQREPVGYLLRSQLELAPVAWPASPGDLLPRRPPRKKPFPHVREAVRATVRGFDGTDRGQLLMACGTGKTLAAMWIAERLDSRRTLILVPSLSLLAQTLREWRANATKPFDYLAVCSDETVVGEDKFTQHTAELGLPVTTDPEMIAAFLRRRGRRVVFATYQSSPQIAASYENRTPAFDLAVADEAHRCAGRVSTEFPTILDSDRIKARRRLFMTATPRYYTPRVRHEAGQVDQEIASMDDEKKFGPVLHRLTFGGAIERDLLSDYQVVVVGVTDSMYRRWAERGEFVTLDGERDTDARSLAGQIGLAKAMRKYDLHRIVSFHGRVNRASEFAREMPAVIDWLPRSSRPSGELWSEHVSGKMSSGQRDRRLRQLRAVGQGERGLLSNARCLGEGVDLPTLDGVAFIDPRRSTIDIIQALGRAIRKAPDKKLGTIVIPVFVDEEADPEAALDDSAFKHVWDVVKALRAHDEQLAEELDELRRRTGELGGGQPRSPAKITVDVPSATVGAAFASAFDARLVEQTTASWEFFFGLLERFTEREGHARVPHQWREGGYKLGQWVNVQRTTFFARKLSSERRTRLEQVEGWTWDALEAEWEEGYAHLTKFVEREGHSRVPKAHHEDGYRLGAWINNQRARYGTGKLDPKRQARLEALPGWVWDVLDAAWQGGFAHLQRFVERAGHAQVPAHHGKGSFNLGAWVVTQRGRFREGNLETTRREQLEALPGWIWHTRDEAWEKGIAALQQYVACEGHSRVPLSYRDANGFRLGKWVRKQRQRKEELAEGRIRRLEAFPDWTWDPRQAEWEASYGRLQAFTEREGHSRVPRSYRDADGFRLGDWVGTQRSLRRRGELRKDRIRDLEALPGWVWDLSETRWEEGYARFRRFAERQGHSRVPAKYRDEDGYRLGQWVSVQRLHKDQLSEERIQRLEALPGWSWTPHEARWEASYVRLLDFVDREGHSRVPQTYRDQAGYPIGSWVADQRSLHRHQQLSRQRTQRLEALPGWVWNPHEAAWEQGFAHLQRFVADQGHARVPHEHIADDGYPLGAWVGNQRGIRRRGKLDPEREARLESLPGWAWKL